MTVYLVSWVEQCSMKVEADSEEDAAEWVQEAYARGDISIIEHLEDYYEPSFTAERWEE